MINKYESKDVNLVKKDNKKTLKTFIIALLTLIVLFYIGKFVAYQIGYYKGYNETYKKLMSEEVDE